MRQTQDIIIILMDQLSAKWLEAARKIGLAPNIEGLAKHGTDFGRCYSSSPMCVPARMSMLTGLHPRQHGGWWAGYQLNPEIPTYMSILKNNGYRTGGFGKFHIAPEQMIERIDYSVYGFERAFESEDWHKGKPGGYIFNSKPSQTGGYFFTVNNKEKTQTECITREGISFINDIPINEPLCAMISYVEPHAPITPPAEYFDRVCEDKLPLPIKPAWKDDPNAPLDTFIKRSSAHPYGYKGDLCEKDPDAFWKLARKHYFADILHLDEQVGKIIDSLEARGGWRNANIILTADHGDMLGDHYMYEKHGVHYDACIRIPLIVSMPGCIARRCDELIQSEDVYFSILEMAELSEQWYPHQPDREVRDGRFYYNHPDKCIWKTEIPKRFDEMPGSFVPFCKGICDEGWRKAAIVESIDGRYPPSPFWARSIVSKRYRYTYHVVGRQEQLFDLKNDPDEVTNLAYLPEYHDLLDSMRLDLIERSTWTEYPLSVRDMKYQGLV